MTGGGGGAGGGAERRGGWGGLLVKINSRGAAEPQKHGGCGPGRRCLSVPLTDNFTGGTDRHVPRTHTGSQVSFLSFSGHPPSSLSLCYSFNPTPENELCTVRTGACARDCVTLYRASPTLCWFLLVYLTSRRYRYNICNVLRKLSPTIDPQLPCRLFYSVSLVFLCCLTSFMTCWVFT